MLARLRRLVRRNAAPAAQAVEATRPLGQRYPGPRFDTGHEWRRQEQLIRGLILALVTSVGVNAIQGGLNHALYAQQRTELVMIQAVPESKQVVTLQPIRMNIAGLKAAAEGWLRSYVDYRHALVPDRVEMERRMRWVNLRSAADVWEQYRSSNIKVISDALTGQLTRLIEVRSITELAEGYYQIDFRVTDTERGRPCARAECVGDWRAVARFAFVPKQLSRQELQALDDGDASLRMGFTVLSYGVNRLSTQASLN